MENVTRTVRLPIERPDDDTWKLMRAVACKSAQFANLALFDAWGAKLNGVRWDANASFKRKNDELSGWVRGAVMQNRVRPYLSRSGRDVLAGRGRSAVFSADRALTISADQRSNEGAKYQRDGDAYMLACRFEPVEIRDEFGKLIGRREPVRLRVATDSPGVRKDWYIREAVEAIWSGAWVPGTITFRFDRRRRKVDAMVSYTKPAAPKATSGIGATLGPFVPDTGELWLRFDKRTPDGPLNFAHRINHMRTIKTNHEGLTHRLRRKMGRGPKRRQVYRKRLNKPERVQDADGKYRQVRNLGNWLRGRMHEMAAEIVKACHDNGVSELRVLGLGEGDLPWHDCAHMLKDKCQDAGIAIEVPSVKQDATFRAEKATIGKRTRKIKKAKAGIDATRELLREPVGAA